MNRIFNATTLLLLSFWTATSSAEEIVLTNGDRLTGEITAQSDDSVTLQHPALGQLVISRTQIADLRLGPGTPVAADSVLQVESDPGLLGTGWLTNWKRRVSLGIIGTSGKSHDLKINADFTAKYEDERKRWGHETSYYRNSADGTLSDQNFFSTLRRDWLEPRSPWFAFADGRVDYDEFKDWDYRLAADAGVGYEFVKTDNYRLLGRAGLGANQTIGGSREELTPEASLGVDVSWKINSQQDLAFVNTLYPNLRQTGELRNLTSLDWRYGIDEKAGLGLKISLSNEYDSLTEAGVSKYDFKYIGALEWSL
jgi:putative salt-induced outer membrane protein YdiY